MDEQAAGVRMRGYLRERARGLAVLAGWSALESGQTFLVGYAVAKALDDGFLRGRDATGLGWLALAAVAVPLGAYGTARVFRGLAVLVEPLRDILVERVVRGGLRAAVRGRRSGDGAVVSRLTHQVEIARDTFGGLVLVLRSFVFTAAGALAGMCVLAPLLLLIVLPPLAVGIALFAAGLRPLARRQHAYLAADEALAEECGALAGGLRDITACGAEPLMAARADARTDTALRTARALARWGVLRAAALAIGGQLPIVLLLLTAPWLIRTHRLTPGDLLGALTYLTQSLQPALQNLVHILGAAGTRLGVVLRRIGGEGDPPDPAAAAEHPAGPGRALHFHDVTFGYGAGAEPVLKELELAVRTGEHLAVVGPSGIGKSTLAALAAGLLRPDRGEVRTAGRPALVPQEAYVLTGTVRENLGYLRGGGGAEPSGGAGVSGRADDSRGAAEAAGSGGPEGADPGSWGGPEEPGAPQDAELLAAADVVGAGPLVATLGGLDAEVDPARLSAGERQLLALARTYLSPAGLVVLDEATCHLDPAAEAVAEEAFARRPGGTLVVIAHRISSARRAGRVLVLDGTHAVCGTHEDLPARSALYRDLVGGWSAADSAGCADGVDTAGAAGVSGSDPAGDLRDADRVHPVAGPRLPGDRGEVVAHGAVGQMQPAGDLGDRGALGAQ
ncbi:ATP-binding cassette, subfamily C [Actinacidiphila yanglinensis]|uniref:ATP-binding cassette, subfamily C n=1 Tax=Actinacidiphila yanglinensis TaxID=310779 RepID=A0A1H5SL78_9ACTN|nr:ATP-binding cassette, subfamily C [Actinacidiphila yanglinensis]